MFKDIKEFLNNLFEKDEVHERLSIILEHHNFLTNILTNKPKLFLQDWINSNVAEYSLLRTESPISINKELQKLPKNDEKGEKDEINKSFKYGSNC